MNLSFRNLALLCLSAIFFSCAKSPGYFAFHPFDDSRLNELQAKLYQPSTFKRLSQPIQFNENMTLWFTYMPGQPVFDQPYVVTLSKKSLGWVETDLKNVTLTPQTAHIIGNYPRLKNGKYLITVALAREILNSVEFEVINERDQREDYIDYEMPLSVVLDSDVDDLRALSRD